MSLIALAALTLAKPPEPYLAKVLQEMASFNAPPVESVEPRVAREEPTVADAAASLLSKMGKPSVEQVGDVFHRLAPGPGGPILIRLYRPKMPMNAKMGKLPLVVYFHGGGFVIANLDTYDASCRGLANKTGAIVASVAYREAPEHKFPAAPDDAYAATKWLTANASSFGGDGSRYALAGESAGGNLATVVAIWLKKEGRPMPKHQLLVYPVTDWVRGTDKSIEANAKAKPLNKAMLGWFKKFYFESPSDANDWKASPIKAGVEDLRGIPPATFIQAGIDPLMQQGMDYAAKLKSAGVKVNVLTYPLQTHEFFGLAALVPQAADAQKKSAAGLRAALR